MDIHGAEWKGNKDVVGLLLNRGAEINMEGEYEQTPLYLAGRKSHRDVVEVLLKDGATL